MKTISIVGNRGELIHSHTAEYNTLARTIRDAISRDVSLKGADFSWQDLSHIDMTWGIFGMANFRGANLSGAIMERADLTGASFRKSILDRTNFTNSTLDGCDFHRASGDSTVFRFTSCEGAGFIKAVLIGSSWTDSILAGCDFSAANLLESSMTGIKAEFAKFANANLSNTDLSCTKLHSATFHGANLDGANLDGADITDAILCHVVGNMIEIRSMRLGKWTIVFTKDTMAIGCEQHKIEEWRNFTDEEIQKMDKWALRWWKHWKEHIFATIDLCYF